jgi:hypothetical protein
VPDVIDATFTPTDGAAKPRDVRGKVEGGAIVVLVPEDLAAGRYDFAVSWRGTAEIASCEGVETCRLPVGARYGMGLRVQ